MSTPVFDCGLLAQNIMLLATDLWAGNHRPAAGGALPSVLRQMLVFPTPSWFSSE